MNLQWCAKSISLIQYHNKTRSKKNRKKQRKAAYNQNLHFRRMFLAYLCINYTTILLIKYIETWNQIIAGWNRIRLNDKIGSVMLHSAWVHEKSVNSEKLNVVAVSLWQHLIPLPAASHFYHKKKIESRNVFHFLKFLQYFSHVFNPVFHFF